MPRSVVMASSGASCGSAAVSASAAAAWRRRRQPPPARPRPARRHRRRGWPRASGSTSPSRSICSTSTATSSSEPCTASTHSWARWPRSDSAVARETRAARPARARRRGPGARRGCLLLLLGGRLEHLRLVVGGVHLLAHVLEGLHIGVDLALGGRGDRRAAPTARPSGRSSGAGRSRFSRSAAASSSRRTSANAAARAPPCPRRRRGPPRPCGSRPRPSRGRRPAALRAGQRLLDFERRSSSVAIDSRASLLARVEPGDLLACPRRLAAMSVARP